MIVSRCLENKENSMLCVQFHLSLRGQLEMEMCDRTQGGVRSADLSPEAAACLPQCPSHHALLLLGLQQHGLWQRRKEAQVCCVHIISFRPQFVPTK